MNFRFVFAPIASLSLVLLFGVCPTLAETITIPITPGALDGANGADGVGGPGGDGAPGGNASAIAIAPADFNNTAITTGGNGGTGGNGIHTALAVLAVPPRPLVQRPSRRVTPLPILQQPAAAAGAVETSAFSPPFRSWRQWWSGHCCCGDVSRVRQRVCQFFGDRRLWRLRR
jgi:hypothetical protein